jgi:hypothetical protein
MLLHINWIVNLLGLKKNPYSHVSQLAMLEKYFFYIQKILERENKLILNEIR